MGLSTSPSSSSYTAYNATPIRVYMVVLAWIGVAMWMGAFCSCFST